MLKTKTLVISIKVIKGKKKNRKKMKVHRFVFLLLIFLKSSFQCKLCP